MLKRIVEGDMFISPFAETIFKVKKIYPVRKPHLSRWGFLTGFTRTLFFWKTWETGIIS